MPSAAINDKPSSSAADPDSSKNGEMSENPELVSDSQQKQKSSQTNFTSPIQQAIEKILLIVDHKCRNLEKRKNKLESYQQLEESGKTLSAEQTKAIEKYDEVVLSLELTKDFGKQFQAIATNASKDAKREAKKAFFVRQQQETAKIREVLIMQDTIQRFANPDVCNDFMNGTNGACKLDERDLKFLEKFPKYVQPKRPEFSNETPFSSSLKSAAEHLSNVVDARSRPFLDSGYSYEQIKELFDKIFLSGYFDKDIKIVPEEVQESQDVDVNQMAVQSGSDLEGNVSGNGGGVVDSGVHVDAIADDVKPSVEAPAATQVPAPAFPLQGTHVVPPQATPIQQVPVAVPIVQQSQIPGATTVRAVEHAYYKHHQYISGPQQPQQQPNQTQPQVNPQMRANMPQQPIHEVIGSGNFFFLQDSEIENENGMNGGPPNVAVPPNPMNVSSQQQQISGINSQTVVVPNVVQASQQPQQQQQQLQNKQLQQNPLQHQQTQQAQSNISTQTFTNQSYYQQQQQQQPNTNSVVPQVSGAGPLYAPPGIKIDQQSHIPSNYQNNQASQNSQPPHAQVTNPQSQLAAAAFVGGAPTQQQQPLPQRTYPPGVHSFPPVHHFQQPPQQQQQQVSQSQQQQQKLDSSDLNVDVKTSSSPAIDNNKTNNNKREWNPQAPQKPTPIDTWINETATNQGTPTSSSYNSRPTSGNYSRSNRSQPPNVSGRSGGYRGSNHSNNPQSNTRSNNVYQNGNGSGDRLTTTSSPGDRSGDTFYRNNDRSNMGGSRYNSNNGSGGYGGPNKNARGAGGNLDNSGWAATTRPIGRYGNNNGSNYRNVNNGPNKNNGPTTGLGGQSQPQPQQQRK